jgi:thiol-disulfide isomerase/thioredoxin
MATAGRRTKTARKASARSSPGTRTFIGAIVLIVILFGVALALTRSGDRSGGTDVSVEQTRAVAIEGGSLPPFRPEGADPAEGSPVPRIAGSTFAGDSVTLVEPGIPTAIVFLAHWCPHCQNEVPAVQAWLDAGGLPPGVHLKTLVTGTNPDLPNYPPSSWLEREGWTPPVLVDDADSSAGSAYGLTGTPYWVFVSADGKVVSRASGELPVEVLEERIADLAP